jgi:hypothetical protein
MQSSEQQFMFSLSNPSMNPDVKYICFTEKRLKDKSLYFELQENIFFDGTGCFQLLELAQYITKIWLGGWEEIKNITSRILHKTPS